MKNKKEENIRKKFLIEEVSKFSFISKDKVISITKKVFIKLNHVKILYIQILMKYNYFLFIK